MKPYWEITAEEAGACLEATHFCPADVGYFRGGGFSSPSSRHAAACRSRCRAINMVAGLGPCPADRRGHDGELPPTWPPAGAEDQPDMADDLVRSPRVRAAARSATCTR